MWLFEGQFQCPACSKPGPAIDHSDPAKRIQQKVCFVATVAFGDSDCIELNALREFRDKKLAQNIFGKIFIKWYYANGERLANWIDTHPFLKRSVKSILGTFVRKLLLK